MSNKLLQLFFFPIFNTLRTHLAPSIRRHLYFVYAMHFYRYNVNFNWLLTACMCECFSLFVIYCICLPPQKMKIQNDSLHACSRQMETTHLFVPRPKTKCLGTQIVHVRHRFNYYYYYTWRRTKMYRYICISAMFDYHSPYVGGSLVFWIVDKSNAVHII